MTDHSPTPFIVEYSPFISQDDAETIAMLRDLKAIRVFTYRIDGDFADFRHRADSMATRLTASGWAPVLVVREEDGFVSALLARRNVACRPGLMQRTRASGRSKSR